MADSIEVILERDSSLQSWNNELDEVAILNEHRRRALERIDNAHFSWNHVKICFVAGVGFFTDAYDMFAVNIMVSMLGYVYGDENGDLSPWQSTGLKVAAPIGNLLGQIMFGWLADVLGRRRMHGAELVFMATATFAQALTGPARAVDTIGILIVWRFIMGIGCGGDYPTSAIIMSEFAPIRTRGRLMTAVYAAQGLGQLADATTYYAWTPDTAHALRLARSHCHIAASLVGMVVVAAYGSAIRSSDYPSTEPVDYAWRLLIGLGCIPGLIAYYCRLTIPETPRFTMDVIRNVTRASHDINKVISVGRYAARNRLEGEQVVVAPRASCVDFFRHFSSRQNLKVLISIAWSWFAHDIPFSTLTLNSSAILTYSGLGKIYGSSSNNVYDSLVRICGGSLLLSVGGYLPGFCATFFLIDSWGRKPIQMMGFIVLTVLFLTMAFAYPHLNSTVPGQHGFIFLYCLTNFFQKFGPNTTTFVIPGELFPTRYRATAYGISAACGRIGVIIAQLALGHQLMNSIEAVQTVFHVLAFVMFTGVLSTLFIPETKQKSLEKLSNEYQDAYITSVIKRGVPELF